MTILALPNQIGKSFFHREISKEKATKRNEIIQLITYRYAFRILYLGDLWYLCRLNHFNLEIWISLGECKERLKIILSFLCLVHSHYAKFFIVQTFCLLEPFTLFKSFADLIYLLPIHISGAFQGCFFIGYIFA